MILNALSSKFMNEKWPKKPFVVHSTNLEPLASLPFLKSLDTMLNDWPNKVQVHLPDVADESSSIDATPREARQKFSEGMALLFNNVQTISPVLQEELENLHAQLGLPTSTLARCMVYATPAGKGTAPHFDQNINFVLQIHGTKKWRIAPNETFINPTERYTIGQPLDSELATYAEGDLPTEMPTENSEEIILKPGSLLYVPRGFWHTTIAEGEALALNFTYSQPTWVDLFTAALRSRLTLSPEWRELANGVTSAEGFRRASARAKFDQLLSELVEDLPNWNAADILAATEGTDDN